MEKMPQKKKKLLTIKKINLITLHSKTNTYTFSPTEIVECTLSDIREKIKCCPSEYGNTAIIEKIIGNVSINLLPHIEKGELVELRNNFRRDGVQHISISYEDSEGVEYEINKKLQFYIMDNNLEISIDHSEKKG